MNLDRVKEIVSSASAIRLQQRLQPAGGKGDKIFPPTYKDAKYAIEKRLVEGQEISVIHLDSVQSQANRMELALLKAVQAKKISLPIVQVDFRLKNANLVNIGLVTTLDAPHRLADAILRDSEKDGVGFRRMPEGKVLDSASIWNAADLFGICPTALVFGIWDSTGPHGGLGVKFQRSIVSEIVAYNARQGVKSSSRIDPLGIMEKAGVAYKDNSQPGGWTLYPKESNPKVVGKTGKPSEINHGNIVPTISEEAGGITCDYALQTIVISLASIRRLHFPVNGEREDRRDQCGHAVLVLLGLCAALLAQEDGYDLRSRCLLVPEHKTDWEVIKPDGSITNAEFECKMVCNLYNEAVDEAKKAGLPWRDEPLTLEPSDGLVELVLKSQELIANS